MKGKLIEDTNNEVKRMMDATKKQLMDFQPGKAVPPTEREEELDIIWKKIQENPDNKDELYRDFFVVGGHTNPNKGDDCQACKWIKKGGNS